MRIHAIAGFMKTISLLFGVCCVLGQSVQAQSTCLRDTDWAENVAPHQQRMEFDLIEQDGDNSIVSIRFSPLTGEFAKLYGFFLHDGICVVRAYVVGAFASENAAIPVEAIEAPLSVRYNQDYYSADTHLRIGISDSAPDYDASLEQAIKLLKSF